MPEDFKGCLVSISNLPDAALEDRILAIGKLLEEMRRAERNASGYKRVAHSAVDNFLSLLEDQAINDLANRKDRREIERCRQSLAEVASPSKDNENDSERQCDRARLQKDIENTEELIRLRQSVKDAVEEKLSALSAVQIDSYLNTVEVPAHDPVRSALNCASAQASMATENSSELSPAQCFKEFAGKTFKDLTKVHPKGVPAEELAPFAKECDDRGYMLNSDFLRSRVLKAIEKYNADFPEAPIENYSALVEALQPVPVSADSVKKRQKNARQEVVRQFRVWLSEMKCDYSKKQPKRSE